MTAKKGFVTRKFTPCTEGQQIVQEATHPGKQEVSEVSGHLYELTGAMLVAKSQQDGYQVFRVDKAESLEDWYDFDALGRRSVPC